MYECEKGVDSIKGKSGSVVPVCAVAFLCNILLFLIKLYVGLSVNSISIYSDGVNNMFDGLSAVVTLVCLGTLSKSTLIGSGAITKKAEALVSSVLCAVVLISGVYFAYSSAERLMYPTPVWFSMRYFWVLAGTAVMKLVMFFIYRLMNKNIKSETVRVMSLDCILDFFITTVTVITLAVSSAGLFSADAFCGIFISIFIIVSAIRLLKGYVKRLVGYVPYEKREELESILATAGVDREKLSISFDVGDDTLCYISYEDEETEEKTESLYTDILKATDITVRTVKTNKGVK